MPPNIGYVAVGRAVSLRPIERSEVTNTYVGWLNNPIVNRYLEVRHSTQTRRSALDYINAVRSRPGCDVLAILTRPDETHVGNVSVTRFDEDGQGVATYGVMVGDARARRAGLGGEASILTIELLFAHQVIRMIDVQVYPENEKAWRTLETLGFLKSTGARQETGGREVHATYRYTLEREDWVRIRQRFERLLRASRIERSI